MTKIVLNEEAVERFFWFARERQAVYLRRQRGLPAPWTQDPIIQKYRFTNLFRENDKTTKWLRENVRDPLRDKPEVLLAVTIFRWFNTIRSGETLFAQPNLLSNMTPFEEYLAEGDPRVLIEPLRRQGPPWVTGAYMIRSPDGVDKLDGIVQCIDNFHKRRGRLSGPLDLEPKHGSVGGWREVAANCLNYRGTEYQPTLKAVWEWVKPYYGQGPFLAYEVVTDLRHTALLDQAPDIMTWMNPGPGALRGANLLLGRVERDYKGRLVKSSYAEAHAVMAKMLELSQNARYWPQEGYGGNSGVVTDERYYAQIEDCVKDWRPGHFSAWEMRDPEMWACEFTKFERTCLGFGRPRGVFS